VSGARALLLALLLAPPLAGAAEQGYPLQSADADVSNLASLQRGARNFVNYCLGCHSAKYMRYSQLATDLALTEDELQQNLMFTGERVYDTMDTAMPAEKGWKRPLKLARVSAAFGKSKSRLTRYQRALVYSTKPERGMMSAQSLASFCWSK